MNLHRVDGGRDIKYVFQTDSEKDGQGQPLMEKKAERETINLFPFTTT